MRPGLPTTIAITATLCFATTLAAQTLESFDKPLHETKIDLGPSDYLRPDTDAHVILNCYYYGTFMVKELDDPGVKGANPVFRPFHPGQNPPCSRKLQLGETHPTHWGGFFMGVKHNLIFIEAEDGLNGALEFQVLDSRTGKRMFHDERYVGDVENLRKLSFIPTNNSQVVLRYRRAFLGTCSIPKHGLACWHTFQRQTGLTSTPMPACQSVDFEGHDQGDDPSVIFYPVETTLLPQPQVKAIDPIDRCSPAE